MKNKPLRIFDGETKPYEPFWRCVDAAESESGEAEIDFYGYISEYSWWEDDITPAKFKDDLHAFGQGKPITIRIHSGGGDVFAASAIRAMIMDYPGRVTTMIDGLCASAATYVAMAGDVVKMQDSAFFMVHNPWMMTFGDEHELREAANFLKKIKAGIIEAYQGKTKLSNEKLSKLMDKETWMTAQDALDSGFIDHVITNKTSKGFDPANKAILNAIRDYENVPPALLETTSEEQAPVITDPAEDGEGDVEDLIQADEETSVEPTEAIDEKAVQDLRDYLEVYR